MSNALVQFVETLFNVLSKCQRKFANSHIENKKSHENLQCTEKIDQLKWHSRQIPHRTRFPIVWQSARKFISNFYFVKKRPKVFLFALYHWHFLTFIPYEWTPYWKKYADNTQWIPFFYQINLISCIRLTLLDRIAKMHRTMCLT